MKNESSKTKEILFRIKIKGNGIVNYDFKGQKRILKKLVNHLYNEFDNTSYAKKNFYGDGQYKIKISSNSLRYSIFRNDMIAASVNIMNSKTLLNSYIGSTVGILRGYLFAKSISLHKSGAFTIVDAEQTSEALSYMEQFTKSGDKTASDNSNTIFSKETIGDIEYQSFGSINLESLQFMSCDPIFGRLNFHPDDVEILTTILKNNIPNFNSEKGYYKLKTSSVDIEEEGIKFSDENVKFLVKELMIRILSLKIKRSGAYAELDSLEYKLVNDPISDNYSNEDGWNRLENIDDIDNMNFDVEEFYEHVDSKIVDEKRLEIAKSINESNKKNADKKNANKKSKDNKLKDDK